MMAPKYGENPKDSLNFEHQFVAVSFSLMCYHIHTTFKGSQTFMGKKSTKTLVDKKATKAPADKKTTTTPVNKKAAKTPADKKATKTPVSKKAAKTPADKKATKTPVDKKAAEIPVGEKAAKTPADKRATKTPVDKKAAEIPVGEKAAKAPVVKRATKTLVGKKATKTLIILGVFLGITITLSALLVYRLLTPPTPQTIYDVQILPSVSASEVYLAGDEEEIPEFPNPYVSASPSVTYDYRGEYDEALEEIMEAELYLEREEFSFENGVEGLEELTALLLAHIEPLGGSYSIYVKNLDTNEYLLINHRQQNAASLIKLFNFAYTFEKYNNGSLELTPFIEQWLYHSIVFSCNNSYNHLLTVIGYGNLIQGAINSTAFAHSQGFEDTVVGGSLHPSDFAIVGFSNVYTSALNVGHLLENIYRGTMVSEEASQQMLDILLAQQRLDKIPAGLPEGTITASKTGEIGGIEHDAAIVFTDSANYIIVIMTENAFSAIHNIQVISRLVYDYFNLASTTIWRFAFELG